MFKEFLTAMGFNADMSMLYKTFFEAALKGEPDCGGLLAYNYFSGEHITGFEEGRPILARTPESKFSFNNFARVCLYSALATLKIGLDIMLNREGVKLEKMLGHGAVSYTHLDVYKRQDITYLHKIADRIRGIVLTHGHEDHIGALPYVLKEFSVPVYGTRLTLGILKNKLKEHGILNQVKLNTINAGDKVKLGAFTAEFIHTNHSIADAVAIALHTPTGIILHTGDFKIDSTPIDLSLIHI